MVDVYISEEAQYPPEVWAQASAEPTLTTNACESFHSHFNSSFYTTHPNIFMFIEKLKEIQIEVYIKLNSINEPFKFQNSKTKKKKREKLENLINKYNSSQIPIDEYVSTIFNYL